MNSTSSLTLGKISKKSVKADSILKNLRFKSILIKVLALILILGIISGGAWQVSKASEGKILPKVTIAGLNVGGKTPTEAKSIVLNYISKLDTSGPQIIYENETFNPKLSEMGVSFNLDNVIKNAFEHGRTGSWKNRISENSKMILNNYDLPLSPVIDEQKLDEYLSQIAKVVDLAPQNAGLNISSGEVLITPSKMGRGLDKNRLKEDLNNAINQNLKNKIILATSDLAPQIAEDDTLNAKTQAEKYLAAAPITVNFEDKQFTANRTEIGTWINFKEENDELIVVIDASTFIGNIAQNVEIATINKEVQDGTNSVLNEGQDGRGMDRNLLSNQIKDALNAGQSTVLGVSTYIIERGQTIIYPHAQPGRYSGKYIDINLSEQTLYAFEGSNLINQFSISSGVSGHATPTGEFSVYGKTRAQMMDGPGYALPNVEWISWWSGDYSIHGTYWHNNFGHPMSHGCVNASNADAEWIYNWDDIGTPVYVHG